MQVIISAVAAGISGALIGMSYDMSISGTLITSLGMWMLIGSIFIK